MLSCWLRMFLLAPGIQGRRAGHFIVAVVIDAYQATRALSNTAPSGPENSTFSLPMM